MLTFIRLNNSIPFITINAEYMLMLTNQCLWWCLDLLGENSLFLSSRLLFFFSTTRCVSQQFSAKQDIHSYLQHHTPSPVKLKNNNTNNNWKKKEKKTGYFQIHLSNVIFWKIYRRNTWDHSDTFASFLKAWYWLAYTEIIRTSRSQKKKKKNIQH